ISSLRPPTIACIMRLRTAGRILARPSASGTGCSALTLIPRRFHPTRRLAWANRTTRRECQECSWGSKYPPWTTKPPASTHWKSKAIRPVPSVSCQFKGTVYTRHYGGVFYLPLPEVNGDAAHARRTQHGSPIRRDAYSTRTSCPLGAHERSRFAVAELVPAG